MASLPWFYLFLHLEPVICPCSNSLSVIDQVFLCETKLCLDQQSFHIGT